MRRTIAGLILFFAMASPLRADELGLKLPPGFKATLWADHELANDIYAMTLDSEGRVLVTSKGWVKLLEDTKNAGKADRYHAWSITETGAMGLCADRGDSLLLCADGWLSISDSSRTKEGMRKIIPLPFTEHGGHAMRKGPDGCWYIIGGNNSDLDKLRLDPASPIQKPQAGGILRLSKDMKKVECVAHGFRNPYDFDFSPLGDIITYDSDTERDYLLPWYTPTRMYHVAHGQHHGWQLPGYVQSLARRDYYPDVVDILWPVGRGSPTGVVCYRHYQFPEHYRGGVFALDWTFGKVYFFPLEPDGSSYKTKPEIFLEPAGINGFAPTGACVAPDGSLFVCIGGRGSRGAVYRIEYVGTKEEPKEEWKEPNEKINKVLDAPQPLDAWSRAIWEPYAANTLQSEGLTNAIGDETRPIRQRLRAIEIMNDQFDGLPLEVAKRLFNAKQWELRARLAWSLGRDCPKDGEKILLGLAWDVHPKVRVEALDALGDLLAAKLFDREQQEALIPLFSSIGDQDKRVRMSMYRLAAGLEPGVWRKLDDAVFSASLRIRLGLAIADHGHGLEPALLPPMKLMIALECLQSKDSELRLDALRLLMLIDGDWCLRNPSEAVYSAYSLQKPPKERRDIEKTIFQQIRKLYPTGDKNFDTEASRYFAMIEDDDPATAAKVAAQITKASSPTDDVHHLIVLSRLQGKRTPEQTAAVVDALLGLEKKLNGLQMRTKLTWGPRLGEVVFNLILKYPGLSDAMLKHPGFVHPSHVLFTANFGKENLVKAARLFLVAIEKDGDFLWTPELVDMLAVLPPEEYRPIFRKQWADYSLRDPLLKHLVDNPEAADRQRFLDGLDSPNRATVVACLGALKKLPVDPTAKNLVPILRRLRLSLQEPKEANLRVQLVDLVNQQAKTEFAIREKAIDAVKLKEVYLPVFAWFEMQHPLEAKLLRGDDEDTEHWQKLLATVPWKKGDAERGLKIFRERSCLSCHASTSRVGPDLTGAAGRFSRDDLFTAIIYPSRDVAPAYRVNDIETQSGKSFSGIVVNEAAEGLIIQTGANATIRIDASDIASRKPSAKSLMPAGLLKDLKPGDLADLYLYLKSLK